jgi:uncharacterized protein
LKPLRADVRAALLVLALALASVTQAQTLPLPPAAPVVDQTGTLTAEQTRNLEQRLRSFRASKGSEISVLIVPTTAPETIEQYAIRVAQVWRLGRAGVEDGVLVVLAKNDRALRIEVRRGLEGALSDVIANRITDQVAVPRFRNGDYYGGLSEAVDRIIAVVNGEPLPEAMREAPRDTSQGFHNVIPLLLMVVFVGGGILRRMFGALAGATVTAGVAGVLAWILTSLIPATIGAAVIAFLFTIVSGGGGGWTNRGGGFGGWGGGFGRGGGGGGGWGGGGGGGWSGGGATGRW